MNYTRKSINFFLDELKDRKPVPGGGSVAALTGAMACGLLLMVCAFSSNKRSKANDNTVKLIEKKAAGYLSKLKKLMEEDIESYKVFSAVAKNKKKSKQDIEKAIRKILNPPLTISKLMPPLMDSAESLAKIAKLSIVSDVSVAASLVLACFEGACVNVKINLKNLNDENLTRSLIKEIEIIGVKLVAQKENVLKEVDERLRMS